MVQRKLVQQGSSTLMISLPSKWCRAHTLTKGSAVELIQREHELTILPTASTETQITHIQLSDNTESIIRTAIINAYRAGSNTVTLSIPQTANAAAVTKTVREYILGFDIAKQETNKFVLESISEPSAEQYDSIFRKLLQTIQIMINGTIARLEKQETFPYQDYTQRAHQYANFCHRVLAKEHRDSASLYSILLTQLIHANRELYHLNHALDKTPIRATILVATTLREAFNLLLRGYQNNDLQALEQLHAQEKIGVYELLYGALAHPGKTGIALYHLGSALRLVYLASSPLIGLILASSATHRQYS